MLDVCETRPEFNRITMIVGEFQNDYFTRSSKGCRLILGSLFLINVNIFAGRRLGYEKSKISGFNLGEMALYNRF
jgi:hypothetical protein